MYTNILGYKVFNKNKGELLKKIENMDRVNIVSGNPEVLYSGLIMKCLTIVLIQSIL